MSKVTTPEAEAYLYENGEHRGVSLHMRGDMDLSAGTIGRGLITTDQAEAYAAAKVREALEEAIAICDAVYEQGESEYRTSCNPYFEGGCAAAESIETKIRALIPKAPGPAEPI